MRNNPKIREAAKAANVCLWEIANYIGVSEPTMTRKMRHQLSEAEESSILTAIKRISETKLKESEG